MQFRQGDIFIQKINKLPNKLEKIKNDEQDRIILAYGEVTGHSHAIKDNNASLFKDSSNDKVYLVITKEVELVHEEHSTIKIPKGNYQIIRQREYTPEEIRTVLD